MWCECIVKGEGEMLCAAHLADGRVFRCPYVDCESRETSYDFCVDYIPGSDYSDGEKTAKDGNRAREGRSEMNET